MPRYTQPRIFQFTPLREGRLTFERAYSRALSEFQFTPLREGRRAAMADISAIKKISIHAPPRGATWISDFFVRGDAISIHAPPRGATKAVPTKQRNRVLFQFTPLREGRRPPPSRLQAAFYFNSRPSARGDKTPQKIFCALSYFNSRPSARGDKGGEADHQAAEISIHAPPRGATYGEIRAATRRIFQFTLLREGRPDRYRSISSRAYFNSRPSARGDGIASSKSRSASNFNSRPSARGDVPSVLHSY